MDILTMDPVTIGETAEDFSSTSNLGSMSDSVFGVSSARTIRRPRQRSLRSAISCLGIGLHTGAQIALRIEPAHADSGIVFRRTDLAGAPIRALYDNVVDTRLSTVIGDPIDRNNRISTIEHLMAALHGHGIDNAMIIVNGPEIPVLDGSASDFLFLLDCAGSVELETPRREIEILKTVRVQEGEASAELRPTSRSGLALDMTIDFPARAIGHQTLSLEMSEDTFREDIAFSRTFTDRREIDALHRVGLARGGSLDNAIVVDGDRVLNPTGLRAQDEFVRHKLLDAAGDLYLAGAWLKGQFIGKRSGHHLNNVLLRTLFADRTAWRHTGSTVPSRRAA